MIPAEGTHAAQMDPVDRRIWRDGVELLTSTGGKEREVRSLLGDLAKQYGRRQLADAIRETGKANVPDPRSYVIGILRDRKSKASVGRSELNDAPAPECSECNDTKQVMVKDPDSSFDWAMKPAPCPECSKGGRA